MNERTAFNFSVAELCQLSDRIVMAFERDKKAFEAFGYSTETTGLINTKTEALKLCLTDDYYHGRQRLATDAKKIARRKLEDNIADLRNRTKLVFGLRSVDYSLFGFTKLGNLKDNDLLQFALHVTTIAQPRLEQLEVRMVTQVSIDTILADRTAFDMAIDAQATAITERGEKKLERMSLANQLYKQVSALCEVGKIIWKTTNEAFYTDYMIYTKNTIK